MSKIVRVNPQQMVHYQQPGQPSGQLVPTEVVYESQPESYPEYLQQYQGYTSLPPQYQPHPQHQSVQSAPVYSAQPPGQMAYPTSAQPLSSPLSQMLPAEVLAAIQQMAGQGHPHLARGIGQQQNYAYTDSQGRPVNGTVSTQAWMVPIPAAPMLPSASAQAHSQSQAEHEKSSPNFQHIGLAMLGTGLTLLVLLMGLALTRSQGYSEGLERNPTVIRQYPY